MFYFVRAISRQRAYSTSTPPRSSQRLKPYLNALNKLSERTKTPLSSLVISFAVLHEITAIIPFAGFFFAAHSLGWGDAALEILRKPSTSGTTSLPEDSEAEAVAMKQEVGWFVSKAQDYIEEGEDWAARVGRRYGLWGYEKGATDSTSTKEQKGSSLVKQRLAGDVANAVLAYGLTKAVFPLRVGLAVYLSPAFSRSMVEPVRRGFARLAVKMRMGGRAS